MADTLAEIYRNTLGLSDFDSNGEATIVTTNSSTSHVIKSIQVSDTDTNIKVNGVLKVNDFEVVALTANSSGTEIIAPSSTVKVKSTAIPFTYEDIDFNTRRNATQHVSTIQAKINGYLAIPTVFDSAVTHGMNNSNNSTEDTFAPNIGANNYHFSAHQNFGSTAQGRVYNNTGTEVYGHTDSYTPKWFDGKQYAYYYGDHSGASGKGINRIDIAAGTASRLLDTSGINNPSSDPKMFGTVNADHTLDKLFFWPTKQDYANVYDPTTNSTARFTSNDAYQIYSSTNTDNKNWYAVKRTNGTYRFILPHSQSEIRYHEWSVGTVHSSANFTTISLSGTSEEFRTITARHSVVGTKFYYLNNDGQKIAAWDFDPDTPTHEIITSGTEQHYDTYGADLTAVVRTPTTSQVNARSYGVTPTLKLRITGITST